MNKVRITAIRQTIYPDLMAKYENTIGNKNGPKLAGIGKKLYLCSRK